MIATLNSKAIRNARRLGYLVGSRNDDATKREWMQIARDESFVFVMVTVDHPWIQGRLQTDIRLVWDCPHLSPLVWTPARTLTEQAARATPGTRTNFPTDWTGAIRGLSMADTTALATRIIGLTDHRGTEA